MPKFLRPILIVVAMALMGWAGSAYYSGSSGGYVVRAGDSLWAIAAAHDTTVARLAAANRLDPDAILPIGKRLTIPGSATVAVASAVYTSGSIGARIPSSSSYSSPCAAGSGPVGALPARLAASSSRLALRPIFERWAAHYGVPVSVLEAIAWQESGWQQNTVSATGAIGVGQVEPATAAFVSKALVGLPLDVNSVSDNIRMSAAYLSYLYRIEGGTCSAVAAYYEGPIHLASIGMYTDTRQYVADVEALIPRFE